MLRQSNSVVSKAIAEAPQLPSVLELNHTPSPYLRGKESVLLGSRPGSWRQGKKALAKTYSTMAELFRGIETTSLGCTHAQTLATALHAFLTMPREQQVQAYLRLLGSEDAILANEADRELHQMIGSTPVEE